MNVIPYIFYPLLIGLIIFTIAFFKFPRYAIAGLIIAKPIIDLTWDYFILLDINFLKLYAGLFVILGVIYIIVKRVPILPSHGPLLSSHGPRLSSPGPSLSFPGLTRESSNCHPEPRPEPCAEYHFSIVSESTQNSPFPRFSVSPFHSLTILWLIFLGLNFISIFIISDAHLLLGKINYFLRILTGFIALIMFAHLFDFKKDKKFVLSIFIIAGIFPILLWLIPVLMGNPIISNDPLRRIIGPYPGFWHFNFYAIQTLICCLAYLAITNKYEPNMNTSKKAKNFSSNHCLLSFFQQITQLLNDLITKHSRAFRLVKRVVLYLMVVISVITVYKCYSKAGWIILATILFVWFLLRRKIIQTILIPVIVAIILSVNPFAKDFQKTFQNEIDYFIHGLNVKEKVFRERLSWWDQGIHDFCKLPFPQKLLGARNDIINPNSDYFRVLWHNGIVGFCIYVLLLGMTGYTILRKYVCGRNAIPLATGLVFIAFLLNSIGACPLLTLGFQWFLWGMIGFILSNKRVAIGTKD